jgi:hypothetical protein
VRNQVSDKTLLFEEIKPNQYGRYQVSDKTLHTQEVNLNREDVKIVKNINEIKSERREIKINTKPYTQKVKPSRGDIKISAKKITRSQVRYGDINIITKRDKVL